MNQASSDFGDLKGVVVNQEDAKFLEDESKRRVLAWTWLILRSTNGVGDG